MMFVDFQKLSTRLYQDNIGRNDARIPYVQSMIVCNNLFRLLELIYIRTFGEFSNCNNA